MTSSAGKRGSPPLEEIPPGEVLEKVRRAVGLEGASPNGGEGGDPFRVLVSAILSTRTKDEVTWPAARRLLEIAGGPAGILSLPVERIEELIFPVGFYRRKAMILREVSADITERFGGEVPADQDALMSLPGVGRKIANLVLSRSFGEDAICVDTHVHRITNRWGLLNTVTPLQTERELMKKVPRNLWQEINLPLVLFGKRVCKPISPHCSTCPLSDVCPKRGVTARR